MKTLFAIEKTTRFNGSYTIVELLPGQQQAYFTGDYKTEATAKAQVTRRFKQSYYQDAERISIEELRAEEQKRQVPVQQQEELQHEALQVVEPLVTTENKQEQAELLIIEMDAVQVELEQASEYEDYASCKAQLVGLKSDIEALGYEVERCVTGWKLVVKEEVAQAASSPAEREPEIVFYAIDPMYGLYACVRSTSVRGKTYRVSVEHKWLYSQTCECLAGQHSRDCRHKLAVDRALDDVRPTFKQRCAGTVAWRAPCS